MNENAESSSVKETNTSTGWKLQFGVLCGMLMLALIGMGLSQALEQSAWWYWLFVVFTYAALGLWRSTRKAKRGGHGLKNLISRELAHWAVLLAFLGVLAVLERKEIISRESSSDFALLLLAFSCCLAGIHFDWLLLIMGVVLTVMLVAMATLEQYTIVLWLVMIVVTVAAAAFFYLKSNRGRAADGLD
ncbi:hypothetical protein Poly41_06680 [Novipirellula artificiosorum]|uniref:Uncharacterized protein n=2 Tax=Novipirellula artificiosorum TaxID=2528016 RepID=A0A5C6E456_9BACT|nr:hypothetical protein Poly41_06680 [Novipirellula artificiosorum]